MADLFVSYSRRDAGFVEKVAGQLSALGISVWVDTEGIDAGDRWKTAITHAVSQARWCMLVLSPRSMESRQVAAEVNLAFDKSRPIIPVLYEACDVNPDIEYALSGVQHVDFTGAFEDGITKLRQALGTSGPGSRLRRAVFDENEGDARTVGRGLRFPMRTDGTGKVAMADRGAAIDDALLMILRTMPGDRVGRPEYGCTIWELAFERFDETTLGAMGDRIRDAIRRWEPRVDDASIAVTTPNRLSSFRRIDVAITYTVRGTHERREFASPLFLG